MLAKVQYSFSGQAAFAAFSVRSPLMLPVVKQAGIDPVYFGLMFIINSCIGLITPPVGSVLNVVCGVGKAPVSRVVRGTLPFVTAYLILLGLFILFPSLITGPLALLTGK